MDNHTPKFKARLGMFIAGGLALFVIAIFIIGKQQNLFNPVFKVTANFYNVSGLQVGNNIRFSGINVGIVDNIFIINDSTVQIDMLIRKNVQQFIKADSKAGIGSEGIIGDRVVIISQGSSDAPVIKDKQQISSAEPVETDAIISGMNVSVINAAIITNQLAEIMIKINSGSGTIGRLLQDSTIAENLNMTILNLLKGYFNRKAKAAEKSKKEVEEKKLEEQKAIDKKKK
jgi:phospholipid/cholesterol/gamma-HCH transport system substrate-binding protein